MNKLIYLLAIGTSFIWLGCGPSKQETVEKPQGVDVTLIKVKEELIPEEIIFTGRFLSDHAVNLSTKLTGTISFLAIEEGESVKAGQLLARINSADLKAKQQQTYASLSEAKAQLETVEKDYQRIESLHNSGSATDKEFDNIKYGLTAAKAKVKALQNGILELDDLLAYADIKAPFDGYVTKKYVAAGDLATPGMPLLTVESSGRLKVIAKIPEGEVSLLTAGDTVEVVSEAAHVNTAGIVSHVNPSSLSGNLQFEATIELPNTDIPALKSGMYAEVVARGRAQKKIMIPSEAIFHQGQLTGVYTINSQNKTSVRWIRTGETAGDETEVLSGLAYGEQIILKSPAKLESGLLVNLTK